MGKKKFIVLICFISITMLMITGCRKSKEEVNENNLPSTEVSDNIGEDEPEQSEDADNPITDSDVSDAVEKDTITFTVEASSTLKATIGGTTKVYSPLNISDENLTTAWIEGVNGDGVGEWISFYSDEEFDLNKLQMTNGYSKSGSLYDKNNRIEEIELISSKGDKKVLSFRDDKLSYQSFDIGFENITGVKIVITKVYKGTKYNDLCISEIKFNEEHLNLILSDNNAAPTTVTVDSNQGDNDQIDNSQVADNQSAANEESYSGAYGMDYEGGGFFDKDFNLLEKYVSITPGVECAHNFALLGDGRVTKKDVDNKPFYAGKWWVENGNVMISWYERGTELFIAKDGLLFREYKWGRYVPYIFEVEEADIKYEAYGKEQLGWGDFPEENNNDSQGAIDYESIVEKTRNEKEQDDISVYNIMNNCDKSEEEMGEVCREQYFIRYYPGSNKIKYALWRDSWADVIYFFDEEENLAYVFETDTSGSSYNLYFHQGDIIQKEGYNGETNEYETDKYYSGSELLTPDWQTGEVAMSYLNKAKKIQERF